MDIEKKHEFIDLYNQKFIFNNSVNKKNIVNVEEIINKNWLNLIIKELDLKKTYSHNLTLFLFGYYLMFCGYEDYYIKEKIMTYNNIKWRDFKNYYISELKKSNLKFKKAKKVVFDYKEVLENPNILYFELIKRKFNSFYIKKFFQLFKIKNLIKYRNYFKNYNMNKVLKKKHAFGCCFYKGYLNNKKAFIKAFDYFKTYQNEIDALKKLSKSNSNLFPKLINYDYNKYVAIEFIEGESLTNYLQKNKITKDFINKLLDFFIEVLKQLDINDIIHRDIRPDNIIICTNKSEIEIKLLDFGFSIINNNNTLIEKNSKTKYIKDSLGDKYRASYFIWDDAISIIKLINDNFNEAILDLKKINTIKKYIGKNQFKLER